ncbi:type II toxin-antitoxin system ParD family antitoxin [Ideonella azotifigens]|nr:type II toxin-antitoxin system ParD family antitoxin [Ideonella azotifigens]
MSISIPPELAEYVSQKVASGEYASDSEVFRDGLRMLRARDRAVEQWLLTDVAASFDDRKKNGTRGVSAEELLSRLDQRRKASTAG